MTRQLDCPCCKKLLYFPDAGECNEDILECICTICKYKYALTYSEVLNFASSVEPLQSRGGQPIKYNRVYQLRALTLNKATKAFQFSTSGQDEKLQALPGDELLLLHTMRGDRVDDLVFVVNCTTGKSCQLLSPSSRAKYAGVKAAAFTLVGGGGLAIFLGAPLLVTVIPSVGVGIYVTRRLVPKERDKQTAARLEVEQKLLQRKFGLQQPIEALRQEKATNQRLVKRFEVLQEKMLRVGDLYNERAERVKSAIMILEKQQELTETLIAGYTKLVEMIDIEYETSRLAEQLPEDVDSRILSKLDELKAIEQQKEKLGLRVDPSKLLSSF